MVSSSWARSEMCVVAADMPPSAMRCVYPVMMSAAALAPPTLSLGSGSGLGLGLGLGLGSGSGFGLTWGSGY